MKSRFLKFVTWLRCQTPTDRALLFLATTALAYLVAGIVSGGRALRSPFFDRGNDLFMDYFNSLRDAAQGARAYTERRVIYPPMANLIFLALSFLVPSAYRNTTFAARHMWRAYPTAVLSLLLFLAIPFFITALMWNVARRRDALPPRALLVLLLNVPLFYLLERGNILLLTLPALLFFLYYYESQHAWQRECALLSLAFAISIKLYPALFLLFLLARKRFSAVLRVLSYSAALLFFPVFAFGGISAFRVLLANILSFAADKDGAIPALVAYLPFLLSLFLFTLALFRGMKAPLCMMLAGAALFTFPALHAVYAYVFLLTPLPALLADNNASRPMRVLRMALLAPLVLYPFLTARLYLTLCSCAVAVALACAIPLLKTQKNTPVN